MNGQNVLIKAATALLNDPRFLYRVGKKIGELGVVRESRNRLIIFLACLTIFIAEKVSILIAAPSGSGKSTLIEIPLKLFPPEFVIRRASFSRKALAFGKESFDQKILYVTECSGGKEARLMLRILQSEGEVAHEYAVGGKTRVARRSGSPVVLTTTTEEKLFEDDATRCLTIRVSEAPNKILAVLKSALGQASKHDEPESQVWQHAIRKIRERAKRSIKLPNWLEFVAEQIPRERVRVQRDWKRCLAFLKVAALCGPGFDKTSGVSFGDYCVIHRILNPALTATAYAVNENEMAIQNAVQALKKELGRGVTTKEIASHLGWGESMTYKYVRAAVKHRLVQHEGGTREKNVKRLLPTDDGIRAFLPSPQLVLKHFPELRNEASYVDPLTGEEVSLD
jgi:energy-coupling factor transporter ATP-binding protein EcfA2